MVLLDSSTLPQDASDVEFQDTGRLIRIDQNPLRKVVPSDLYDYTKKLCLEHELPISIVVALISVESDWNQYCRSYNKTSDTWDLGLGQINDRNLELFSRAYFQGREFIWWKAKDNICVVVHHLSELVRTYHGNMREALIAYNVGDNGRQVKRLRRIGIAYAERIYKRLSQIQS